MKRNLSLFVFLIAILAVYGCTVRTYKVIKDRVDQEITGNRGCIQGECPQIAEKERRKTRDAYVIEVEFGSQSKQLASSKPKSDIEQDYNYTVSEPTETVLEEEIPKETELKDKESYTTYTTMKGDTLQKISKKFYGTYRKWKKIYEANKDKIKDPNRIREGIVINIPE